VRVSNAFANFGKWNGKRFVLTPIATFADLCAATEFELKAQPNFGQKSLAEVKEALASYGLQLNPATYTDLCAATAEGMKDEASC
jgi:sugar phosphate isomerase/epimerase